MFGFFKKKDGGFDIETLLKIGRSFGIDPAELAEKHLPKLLAAGLALEHKAGARLLGTISISDDGSHFVVCVYRILPGQNAELWHSFPLADVPALINQAIAAIRAASTEETNDATADLTPQSIAALAASGLNGAGSSDEWNWAAAGTAGAISYGPAATAGQQPEQQSPAAEPDNLSS